MNQLFVVGLLTLVLMPSYSFGAWFIDEDTNGKELMIDDYRYAFQLGGMTCGVTKTEFKRMGREGPIVEGRELYCWTAKDTKVSVAGTCDSPWSVISFTIRKADKVYTPTLFCRPGSGSVKK